MEEQIKNRLNELYKRLAHITDEKRVWLTVKNAPMTRYEEILVNKHLIKELETLLGETI